MQADLAKVGIKAKVVSFEWGEYRKRVQQGEHQMAELGWTGDNGDPDNFFVPLAGCAAARAGWRQRIQVVQPGVRRADQQGRYAAPTRRSARSCTSRLR